MDRCLQLIERLSFFSGVCLCVCVCVGGRGGGEGEGGGGGAVGAIISIHTIYCLGKAILVGKYK